MFDNEQQSVINCFNTRKGSVMFVRDFGLDCVDSNTTYINKNLVIQLATYYPTFNINNVSMTTSGNGTIKFNITVNNKG